MTAGPVAFGAGAVLKGPAKQAPDAGNAAAEGNGLTGSWADGPHPHGLPTGRVASRPAVDQRVAFEAQGAPCGSAHRCLPGGRQGTTRLFIGRLFQGPALDIVAREANVDIKLAFRQQFVDRWPGWHAAVAACSARVADVAATKIAATNIPAHCGPSLATTSRPLRQTQHSRAIGPCLNRLVNERGWRGCRDLPRRRNRTPDHRRGCHQRSQRRNRR